MARSFKPYAFGIVAVLFALFATSHMALAAFTALNIDHKSVASADHTVDTVTGEITCTEGDSVIVFDNVFQGKSGTFGINQSEVFTCTGSSQLWSLDNPVDLLPGLGGEYDNGPALSSVESVDFTDGTLLHAIAAIIITGPNNN